MTTPTTSWRKSSFSASAPNCVEIATAAPDILVRDSKNPDDGHVSFAPAELAALVNACTDGRLDHLAVGHGEL